MLRRLPGGLAKESACCGREAGEMQAWILGQEDPLVENMSSPIFLPGKL